MRRPDIDSISCTRSFIAYSMTSIEDNRSPTSESDFSDFIAFVAFISGNFYTKFSIGKAKHLPIMSYPGLPRVHVYRRYVTELDCAQWYSIGTTVITST
jgi:hypothetical protein